VTPIMADQPAGADSGDKRSSVKVRLTSNRRRRSVENDGVCLVHPPHPARLQPPRRGRRRRGPGPHARPGRGDRHRRSRGGQGPARLRLLLGRDRRSPWHHPPGRSATLGEPSASRSCKRDRAIIRVVDSPTIYGRLLLVSPKLRATDPQRLLRRSVHGQGLASPRPHCPRSWWAR
jgi:hypothetical protein